MGKVSGLFQDLTTIKKARNGRLASWDQRGKNQDYWEIPAKESIVLGEVEGPGCITHIWRRLWKFILHLALYGMIMIHFITERL